MHGPPSDDPGADEPESDPDLAELERRFYRHGLTSFVDPRRNLRSVPARVLPLLAATLCAEAAWLATARWAAVLRVLLVVVVAPLAYGVIRRLTRRRRPAEVPPWLNYLWLSAFVALAPAIGYVAGLPGPDVLGFVLVQAVIAVLVVVGAVAGLVGAVLEAAGDLVTGLVQSVPALLRTLPFLTLFSLVIFLTSETWQVFGPMSTSRVAAVAVVFGALGAVVLLSRLPASIGEIERLGNAEGPPLRSGERRNIAGVVAVQATVQILSVVVLMALVFLLLGSLAIGDEVYRRWEVDPGPGAWRAHLLGDAVVVSGPLLRVSVVIAVVCGLSYAVSVFTDPTYRADLIERVSEDMTGMLRLRRRYLAALDDGDRARRRRRRRRRRP